MFCKLLKLPVKSPNSAVKVELSVMIRDVKDFVRVIKFVWSKSFVSYKSKPYFFLFFSFETSHCLPGPFSRGLFSRCFSSVATLSAFSLYFFIFKSLITVSFKGDGWKLSAWENVTLRPCKIKASKGTSGDDNSCMLLSTDPELALQSFT